MRLLGEIGLAVMGMTLGLVGAGGSILTIPILVYLLEVPFILATTYSLVVVGSTAVIGLVRYRHHILLKKSIVFLIPSGLGVFAARYFMIPSLSHAIGSFSIDRVLLILLLMLMSVAGYFMIRNFSFDSQKNLSENRNIKVVLLALVLGVIIGLLGAGGGFLIIPTLVLFMGFRMQEAIPTSLFIISVNSAIGFASDQHQFMTDDWIHLAQYLAPALLGMLMGLYTESTNRLQKHRVDDVKIFSQSPQQRGLKGSDLFVKKGPNSVLKF